MRHRMWDLVGGHQSGSTTSLASPSSIRLPGIVQAAEPGQGFPQQRVVTCNVPALDRDARDAVDDQQSWSPSSNGSVSLCVLSIKRMPGVKSMVSRQSMWPCAVTMRGRGGWLPRRTDCGSGPFPGSRVEQSPHGSRSSGVKRLLEEVGAMRIHSPPFGDIVQIAGHEEHPQVRV